jgi:hypothetical protein
MKYNVERTITQGSDMLAQESFWGVMQLDFNIISFLVSLLSLALGGLAIWLSLKFKEEANRTNEDTRNLLVEIRTVVKTVAAVAMPELQRYGDMSRQVIRGVVMSGSQTMQVPTESPTPEEDPLWDLKTVSSLEAKLG